MAGTKSRSIYLFQYRGIDVFLHWSWFLVALLEINSRAGSYSSFVWNVLEYLALFLLVLLHEFGHALACQQVGGRADRIILWPLGGLAYVRPPQRPGATLWSVAAGPLVNVVLMPILVALVVMGSAFGWADSAPDVRTFLLTLAAINGALLIFNLLPIYPLDGGQILRSLLWYWLGRAQSLMVAAIVGIVGVALLSGCALLLRSVWLGAICVFMLMYCWRGLRGARVLVRVAKAPRREGFACPSCKTAPPTGPYWFCSRCRKPFDTFLTGAACPNCGARFDKTACLDCGSMSPMSEWTTPGVAGVAAASSFGIPNVVSRSAE